MASFRKNYLHLTIGVVLALLVLLLVKPVNGLTEIGVRTLAVSVLSVYWWITIGIDWVSLLCMALYVFAGSMSFSEIAAISMGNWITTFIIAICMLNYALVKEGFMERVVTWFISRDFISGRPWVFLSMFAMAVYILNVFLNCTEVILLMIPVCKNICEEIGYKPGEKFPTCLYIILMWATLAGFAATPIGHGIPLMVIGLAQGMGLDLTVGQWMAVGFPSTFLIVVLTVLVCRFIIRPDVSRFSSFDAQKRKSEIKPMALREKLVVTVYLVTIALFVLPALLNNVFPSVCGVLTQWGSGPIAIAAVSVLVILRVDDQPLLDFKEGLQHVSWGSVFLGVGTFALGGCLTAENGGIILWMNTLCKPIIESLNSWVAFALIASAIAVVLTNFMSIPAVANLTFAVMVPLCVAVGDEAVVSPVAISLIIGILSNMGTMTPPASIPSMMLLGTEYLSASDGFKYGIYNMIFSTLIGVIVIYPLCMILL